MDIARIEATREAFSSKNMHPTMLLEVTFYVYFLLHGVCKFYGKTERRCPQIKDGIAAHAQEVTKKSVQETFKSF